MLLCMIGFTFAAYVQPPITTFLFYISLLVHLVELSVGSKNNERSQENTQCEFIPEKMPFNLNLWDYEDI